MLIIPGVAMDVTLKYLSVFITISMLILFTSAINATIVWWLWPMVVPVIMPKMVELSYVPGDLSWTTAFALCWLMSIVFSKVIYNSAKE